MAKTFMRRIFRFRATKNEARLEVARARMRGCKASYRFNETTGKYVITIN